MTTLRMLSIWLWKFGKRLLKYCCRTVV